MGELRAYALAVAELRGLMGATGGRAEEVRALAREAYAPPAGPRAVHDLIGPLYRRVPGTPVLRVDDPGPEDLDVLLAGTPVAPVRAAATWRLVEALVAGLAWSATRLADVGPPAGMLAATGLAVPPLAGLVVGWCPVPQAVAVPGLRPWLAGAEVWVGGAARVGRPAPDVLVFST